MACVRVQAHASATPGLLGRIARHVKRVTMACLVSRVPRDRVWCVVAKAFAVTGKLGMAHVLVTPMPQASIVPIHVLSLATTRERLWLMGRVYAILGSLAHRACNVRPIIMVPAAPTASAPIRAATTALAILLDNVPVPEDLQVAGVTNARLISMDTLLAHFVKPTPPVVRKAIVTVMETVYAILGIQARTAMSALPIITGPSVCRVCLPAPTLATA